MPRLLMVGLDAAERTLVRRWADTGYLPNLARLASRAGMHDLGSPALQFPDQVWPSIYLSRSPANLNRYFYIRVQPGEWKLEMVGDDLAGTPFWVEAGRHGRLSVVVDAPKTALSPPFNGRQIACWGSHASHAVTASHPPELLESLISRHGRYPLHSCDAHGESPHEYRLLRDQLLAGVAAREKLLAEMVRQPDWDLFFSGFSETHCAGHHFWHLQDENHPRHDPSDQHGLKSAMRDVYQAVDRAIGTVIKAAGPGVEAMIFTGHGMGPQYHGRELMPSLLAMWGMLEPRNIEPGSRPEHTIAARKSLLKRFRDAVPMPLQYAVKSVLPEAIEKKLIIRFMGADDLNPESRAVYVPNNDLNSAVRINLKGRDKYGKVAPGAEYDELCAFLTARFVELINPATGRPAVDTVTKVRDEFDGRYIDELPDLTIFWNNEHSIDAVHSPGYGTVVGSHSDPRSGGHTTKGFLIPPEGRSADFDLADPDVKDLAPTVLSILDVPVPPEMEGRSLLRTSLNHSEVG